MASVAADKGSCPRCHAAHASPKPKISLCDACQEAWNARQQKVMEERQVEKRSREEARRERELQKQIRAAAAAAPAPAPAPAPASTGYTSAPLPGFSGFQTKKIAGAAPIKFSLDFGKKL